MGQLMRQQRSFPSFVSGTTFVESHHQRGEGQRRCSRRGSGGGVMMRTLLKSTPKDLFISARIFAAGAAACHSVTVPAATASCLSGPFLTYAGFSFVFRFRAFLRLFFLQTPLFRLFSAGFLFSSRLHPHLSDFFPGFS